MSSLRFPALLPLVLMVLVGCTSSTPHTAVSATGAMQLAVHLPEALPAEVSRVTVTVSGSDMPTLSTDLALTDSAWGGVLGDIPAGLHRTFLAQAFTSSNALRYQGQAEDVTVTASTTGLVSLTLQDVSPPPPFSNEAPVVDSLVASVTTVAPGASLSLTSTAHDPNPGDTLTYSWSAPSGSFSAPSLANTSWTAPSTQGPVQLALKVSDSRGASLSVSLTVNVSLGSGSDQVAVGFNTAPKIVSLTSSQSVLDLGQQTSLSVSATDGDGDSLSYQWTSTCSGSFTGATSPSATFSPSALPTATCNNCQLTVTLKDGRGGTNTGSLSLCVAKDTRHAPPSLTRSYQSSLTAKASQQLTFEVGAVDPAGSALSFAWTATVGTLDTPSTGTNASRIVWTAPACAASGSTPGLTATVTNGYGLSTPRSFSVTGLPACGPTSSWALTGYMSRARYGHTAGLLANGKVLVSGGYNGSNLSSSEVYDPSTGTWSTTGSMNSTRTWHLMTPLSTGKVLVVGGYGDEGYLKTAELYDPATGTWSLTGAPSSPRYGARLVLLPNGKVLVVGGYSSTTGYLATAELYDPATGTWSTTGSMSLARHFAAAAVLANGKVLISGGVASNGSEQVSSELYDPASGTWSPTGSMAAPRQLHSMQLLSNGKVLVTAGYNNGVYLSVSELYDPASGTWSATGSMALTRQANTITLLSSGKVLVTGGYGGSSYIVSTELYDPASGTWSSAGSMNYPRDYHTATVLSNGKLLVSGGYSSGSFLTSAEVYSP